MSHMRGRRLAMKEFKFIFLVGHFVERMCVAEMLTALVFSSHHTEIEKLA